MMRMSGAVVVAVVAALAVVAPAAAETPRDTLVIATNLDSFTSLDPAALNESTPAQLVRNICDPLIFLDYDDPAKVVPGLAESWTISEDGLTWRFKLRAGLKHPSGNPVTAEDVAWSMRRTARLNLANGARLREWGFDADRIEDAVRPEGDLTLVLKLDKAYAPTLFPYALTDIRVAAALDKVEVLKHEKNGDLGNAWLTINTACYGPYRMRTWRANDMAILDRNDGYWRGRPEMARVVVRHVPEPGAQRLLLEKGDIDLAQLLGAADISELQKNPNVRVLNDPSFAAIYLSLSQKDPVLSHPKVREAFRYLIDYRGLEASVMNNLAVVRQSYVPFQAFGALPSSEEPFHLDLDRAKRLLAEAGVPQGWSVDLATTAQYPFPEIGQHIQGNAGRIGVEIKLRQMSSAQVFTLTRARSYQLALGGYGYNYPDANNMTLRMAINPDNRDDAKLTLLLAWRASWDVGDWFNRTAEAAQLERDPARRIALYHELQRRYMAEAPLIFLFQQLESRGMHRQLKELKANGTQTFYATARKS